MCIIIIIINYSMSEGLSEVIHITRKKVFKFSKMEFKLDIIILI